MPWKLVTFCDLLSEENQIACVPQYLMPAIAMHACNCLDQLCAALYTVTTVLMLMLKASGPKQQMQQAV